MYTTNWQNY